MEKKLVGEKIIKIITKCMDNNSDFTDTIAITLETSLDELNISSIDFIKVIIELEEEFDLEFDNEMLLYEAFTDINSIVKYIIKKQSN